MKKILSFVILLIVLNAKAQQDANAKKILNSVSTAIKNYNTLTGNFSIKTLNSKGKAVGTKTGSLSMKGNKYLLKQGKTEILCDGNKTYTYDGAKTITVADAEDANKSLTPQKILSGDYDKDFNYTLVGTKGNLSEIELKPTDARKNFTKVNVFIDKTKNLITKAAVLDKSNNTLEFLFTNIKTKVNLADNLFVFNKSKYPKDVELLD